jgi:hypothetical protein
MIVQARLLSASAADKAVIEDLASARDSATILVKYTVAWYCYEYNLKSEISKFQSHLASNIR